MIWNKIGMVFDLNIQKPEWLKSHAMMPVPLELHDRIRVYFTGRHNDGKSRISYFDVSKINPKEIIYVHDKPLLEIGKIGSFDDSGTVGTFVMKKDDLVLLYYNGYNVRNTVPWSNSIGLAVSSDNGNTFQKEFEGPIMDRNTFDPYFTITPCIIVTDKIWHMWYTSGTGWLNVGQKVEPLYNIKYAYSHDGRNWIRENQVCIPQSNPEECTARASILQEGDKLKMWFIYRGSRDFRDGIDSYRIGYAEGNIKDPTTWIRMDQNAGISPGPENFDNMMQAYPGVLKTDHHALMFYNGNNFGQDGIACATLSQS